MQIYQADFCNENEMCVFIYKFILVFTYLSISLAKADKLLSAKNGDLSQHNTNQIYLLL